jgi:hypothetical protein
VKEEKRRKTRNVAKERMAEARKKPLAERF